MSRTVSGFPTGKIDPYTFVRDIVNSFENLINEWLEHPVESDKLYASLNERGWLKSWAKALNIRRQI